MNTPQSLLERLSAIGESLSRRPQALALLALGSVGRERERLDAYSDLDFFAVVQAGSKQAFLGDLSWLSEIAPIAYCFRNTTDGFKLLYSDGVFCEFAVFDEQEMETAIYTPGELIWKAEEVDAGIAMPRVPVPEPSGSDTDWLLGEALTNLYVGLMRDRRGEHLSAMRFIQSFALDRVIDLFDQRPGAAEFEQDPFNPERRLEQRQPELAELLPGMTQGYRRNQASALAILDVLEQRYRVSAAMASEIRSLCTFS